MRKEIAKFDDIGELTDRHAFLRKLFVNEDKMHFHKVIEIGLCVSGRGNAEVAERNQPFSRGDYIISFPFQHHCNRPDGDCGEECFIKWVFIYPVTLSGKLGNKSRILTALIEEISIFGVISSADTEAHAAIEELFNTIVIPKKNHQREWLYSSLCLSLIRLAELSESAGGECVKLPKSFHTVSRSLDLLNENIEKGEIPTVEQLAAAAKMPLSTFRRRFGVIMATSPKKYITDCAVKYACFLLISTDKSISEIACACGFYEISTFGRAFRSTVGMSPKKIPRA